MCVWLRSSCICGGQSGRKTPFYQHWSSIYYQGIIQSGQHHYRQPESNPGSKPLEQSYPYPGSGWTVLSIHKMLFTVSMGFMFRHLRQHFCDRVFANKLNSLYDNHLSIMCFSIDVSKPNFVYIWYICKSTDCLLNIK